MVVIRGVFGFIFFFVIFLLVLLITNIMFVFFGFMNLIVVVPGFPVESVVPGFLSQIWSGVVGSMIAVGVGKLALDTTPERLSRTLNCGCFHRRQRAADC